MRGDEDRQLLGGTCRRTDLISARSRSDIIGCDEDLVIKLYSPRTLKEVVEEEVYYTNLAQSHGLRVPSITSLVEDHGRWGYAYRRITGPTLLEWAVERVETTFDEVPLAFAGIHREIHGHYDSRLPPIRSQLRSEIEAGKNVPPRLRAKALRALQGLPEGTCICHGDFHPENIIMAEGGPIVLDWVDAASGHHMADVVRTYLLLDVWLPTKVLDHGLDLPGTMMDALCQGYREAYFELSDGPDELFYRWLLPVAVARLCLGARREEDRLLRMIGELI